VRIDRVSYTAPVAAGLVTAALADLAGRYGGDGDGTPVDPAQFEPPDGTFLVAWLDGRPAGCGGWRTWHGDPDVAEIKRMYTVPEARGRGVATALLRALEDSARRAGRTRAVLETGDRQPEAIALYQKAGYQRIPDFGFYKEEPGVRSFGRDLRAVSPGRPCRP
jgi:GNAT superfamily N-acetyltransferase